MGVADQDLEGRRVGSRRRGSLLGSLAPYLALLVVATGLVWVAVSADGYQAHDARLHDGGVWVTNGEEPAWGRLNKPINQLEARVPAGLDTPPDVAQDGAAVVALDPGKGTAVAIDPAQAEPVDGEQAAISPETPLRMRGGTLAVVDPASGKLWAQRIDPVTGVPPVASVGRDAPPTTQVGKEATLEVSTRGTVAVVSAADDTLTTIRPSGVRLGQPEETGLEHGVGPQARVTMVGETPVVLDEGRLSVVGGPSVDVDPRAVLQQPGPADDSVVLAEPDALVEVDLESGERSVVADGLAGALVQPVRLGACVFGAWAGSAGVAVQRCGDGEATRGDLGPTSPRLVFRTNRGEIVLNDVNSGALWEVDVKTPKRIDDWDSFDTQVVPSKTEEQKNREDLAGDQRPPEAKDDHFGARPGRTTVLYPLDNDAAPQGRLLAITQVTGAPRDTPVTVSPDGQTVQVRLPASSRSPVSFEYVVNDGRSSREGNATATVTVSPRAPSLNAAPTERPGLEKPRWTVPAGGVLEIPVLPDWRDYADGDPLSVASAAVDGGESHGTAGVIGNGRIRFSAPAQGGRQTIDYAVTDGTEQVERSVSVQVQRPKELEAVPPVAQPDVVSGEVGQPITIRPLGNDHPGSDPSDPDATLALAERVAPAGGASVQTDLASGVVTVRSERPGPILLDYRAAYGTAPYSGSQIRVDVKPADQTRTPVAMPDQATVFGQTPRLVDALANDLDPGGRLLSVQTAETDAPEELDVAVVDGRWVRVSARVPSFSVESHVVRYTISNGTHTAEGEIVVDQEPDLADDAPVTETDRVTVRAGSSVAVPVLRNDFSPSGSPLELVDDLSDADAGQLVVRSDSAGGPLGRAYVADTFVRYVAPASLAEETTATIQYAAVNERGVSSPGRVEVTVLPAEDNRPPQPPLLEGRVMSGGQVTLRVPAADTDPDGDPVTLTAIPRPPQLGRVLQYGANSILYEAFPGSAGTDELTYQVEDPHGGVATGTARIAVAEPASPQPPLAVADTASAAPGRTLRVDALANDHVAEGDRVRMSLVDPPAGVRLEGDQGPIMVDVPDEGPREVKVRYTLSNGTSSSAATVVVRRVEEFNNPPVVPDAYGNDAEGGATEQKVTVDLLGEAYDPDGPRSELKVTEVQAPPGVETSTNGRSVTIARASHPMVVPVRVEDADGGAATASVYVPAADRGLPYATGLVEVAPGGSATAQLDDHVVNPTGGPVRLTVKDRIWPSPADGISARVVDEGRFEVTALEGYRGPAVVNLEVSAEQGEDARGEPLPPVTSVVAVPVQVGDTRPVLRCPSEPFRIAQGQTMELDVTSVCHTWTQDPGDAADLSYAADWSQPADGLNVIDPEGRTVSVAADAAAREGTTGTLGVSADGSEPGQLQFVVVAEPPPTLAPVPVDDMEAGESRTIDLASYLTPGVASPSPRILEVRQITDLDVSAEADGSRLTLNAGDRVDGRARFEVLMTDVDSNDPSQGRTARSQVSVQVLDVPDAPSAPVVGRTVQSEQVQLSWRAPEANGSPVTGYRVTADNGGGTHQCPTTECTIDGLVNGESYHFTVEARNAVGWSEPSPASAAATPDEAPEAVRNLRVTRVGDGQTTLAWEPPGNKTSAIEAYIIRSTSGIPPKRVSGTTVTIGDLSNDTVHSFEVFAENALAVGPGATISGVQTIGQPAAPTGVTVEDQELAGGQGAVEIGWSQVSPNGPAPVTYTVHRNGTVLPQCRDLTTTTCTDSGLDYDGSTYRYTVTATNSASPHPGGAARTSAPSQQVTWQAVGRPADWGSWSASTPTSDGKARVSYTVPDSRGARTVVKVYVDGQEYRSYEETGRQTKSYDFAIGDPKAISLQVCNEKSCGARTSEQSVTTYGRLEGQVSISAEKVGAREVRYSWRANGNGRSARLEIGDNHGWSQTISIGAGSSSNSGTRTYDWSTSVKFAARLVDSSGAADRGNHGTESATVRTDNEPPPPPRTVHVERGDRCHDGSGGTRDCPKPGTQCLNASCGFLQVTLSNFNQRVTCRAYDVRNGEWWSSTYDLGDGTHQPGWYYGWPGSNGGAVRVTCDGVDSNTYTWPND